MNYQRHCPLIHSIVFSKIKTKSNGSQPIDNLVTIASKIQTFGALICIATYGPSTCIHKDHHGNEKDSTYNPTHHH